MTILIPGTVSATDYFLAAQKACQCRHSVATGTELRDWLNAEAAFLDSIGQSLVVQTQMIPSAEWERTAFRAIAEALRVHRLSRR